MRLCGKTLQGFACMINDLRELVALNAHFHEGLIDCHCQRPDFIPAIRHFRNRDANIGRT